MLGPPSVVIARNGSKGLCNSGVPATKSANDPGSSKSADPANGSVAQPPRARTGKRPTGSLEWVLFLVTLGCVLWTLWLILLTMYPNDTINKIMETEHYDKGAFWLLIEPTLTIKCVGVFSFAVVIAGYAFILLKLTLWRKSKPVKLRHLESAHKSLESFKASVQRSIAGHASDSRTISITKRLVSSTLAATSGERKTRKFMVRYEVCITLVVFGHSLTGLCLLSLRPTERGTQGRRLCAAARTALSESRERLPDRARLRAHSHHRT